MTYRSAIDIDAPPELVWLVLMDVERWPEWTPTVTTAKRLETGMFRTGSNVRLKQPRMPETLWRVSSLTPQEAFTWTSSSRGVNTVARHVISAREGGGTRAEGHLRQTGPLGWFARLFFARMTKKYLEQESQGLKKRCEQQANAANRDRA
jgi:uncharacterized protein YndB with AHSA1/START domain